MGGFGFPGIAESSELQEPPLPELDETRDAPAPLAQPITATEYAAIEVVIGHLNGLEILAQLTDVDAIRLRAAIQVLELTHAALAANANKPHGLWSRIRDWFHQMTGEELPEEPYRFHHFQYMRDKYLVHITDELNEVLRNSALADAKRAGHLRPGDGSWRNPSTRRRQWATPRSFRL